VAGGLAAAVLLTGGLAGAGVASAGPTPGGDLSVVAGRGTSGAPTPGTATSSALWYPAGVAVDSSGDVYIADTGPNEIEKVTPGGVLSIFAGTGNIGPPAAGAATSSNMANPKGIAVDRAGNVYVADSGNQVIEKITPTGELSFFAGTRAPGAPTAGPATSSDLSGPTGVAVNGDGDAYIVDTGNYDVEEVTGSTTVPVFTADTPPVPVVGVPFSWRCRWPEPWRSAGPSLRPAPMSRPMPWATATPVPS
jgi:secreted PhoX family phosphatase